MMLLALCSSLWTEKMTVFERAPKWEYLMVTQTANRWENEWAMPKVTHLVISKGTQKALHSGSMKEVATDCRLASCSVKPTGLLSGILREGHSERLKVKETAILCQQRNKRMDECEPDGEIEGTVEGDVDGESLGLPLGADEGAADGEADGE